MALGKLDMFLVVFKNYSQIIVKTQSFLLFLKLVFETYQLHYNLFLFLISSGLLSPLQSLPDKEFVGSVTHKIRRFGNIVRPTTSIIDN